MLFHAGLAQKNDSALRASLRSPSRSRMNHSLNSDRRLKRGYVVQQRDWSSVVRPRVNTRSRARQESAADLRAWIATSKRAEGFGDATG